MSSKDNVEPRFYTQEVNYVLNLQQMSVSLFATNQMCPVFRQMTPHPSEFKFWGVMKQEVLGVFLVHMAHDWSIYWKILTFAGKNLEISNISVIYVCLKFWPKMTKNRLKTKNLQQFCYVWCHFFIRITIVYVLIVLHLFFNQKTILFCFFELKNCKFGI